MIKKLLTVALIISSSGLLKAQVYPLKTIQEIQTVSQTDLAAGIDASPIGATDTIRVRGVVVMDANLSTALGGKQLWIQTNDGSPFSGLDISQTFPGSTTPGDAGTGILSLLAGDSVEITGTVIEFAPGETELIPLNTSPATPIILLGGGITPKSKLINVADLNDANRANILTTGEQWEGMYVEFQNVTVQSVDPFAGGARVSFNITDAAGNKVNVSDRFKSNRLPPAGTFVAPNVGDFITSIKGVIVHSKNVRGYELQPFKQTDIVYGASAPAIAGITPNPITPTSTQTITISATITDLDGVDTVSLFYAAGVANNTFIAVPMLATANIYSATLPAQPEGTIVKYYISATDASAAALVSKIPNVPSSNPLFYVVRDAGLQIFDLQFTPFTDGNSGLINQQVTVSGIVTSSANDLGYVFMQQENKLDWAGIMCLGSATLNTLAVGDKITATGTVRESFGFTRLEAITSISKNGSGTINPIVLPPSTFNTYNFANNEAYEGMLVKFEGSLIAPLTVVKKNADAPAQFGDYSVGLDPLDPASSSRVLAGRQTGTTFSSLNVSYINDSLYIPNLNVGISPVVVNIGDRFTSMTGIMYYGFNNLKLLPRNNADVIGYLPAVGINSFYAANSFVKAFPNPASTSFTVNYTLPAIANNAKVVVYDLLGKEIFTQKLAGVEGLTVISVNDFANGTYLYQVQSAATGILAYGKLVVSK